MQLFTYGVKAADGLLETRVCLLLCLVFVCFISRDADASTATNELPIRHPSSSLTPAQLNSAVTIEFDFRHIDPKNRAALIAAYREVRLRLLRYLNRRKSTTASPTFSTIATLKATTISVAADTTIVTTPSTLPTSTTMPTTTPSATSTYPTTSPTTTTATTSPTTTTTTTSPTTTSTTTSPTTTAATTTQTSTIITSPTMQSTTAAAPATQTSTIIVEIKTAASLTIVDTTTISPTTKLTPHPERKRRRRRNDEEADILFEDDLSFVDNEPEIDEHGNVRMTILINKTARGDRDISQFEFDGIDPANSDLGEVLYKAATAMDKSSELEEAVHSTVVAIYKGLPAATEKVKLQTADWANLYLVWLPILLAIGLTPLLLILIFTFHRKATNKKVKDEEFRKIIPKLDSKPASSNGHAAGPMILDDYCEWMIHEQ